MFRRGHREGCDQWRGTAVKKKGYRLTAVVRDFRSNISLLVAQLSSFSGSKQRWF